MKIKVILLAVFIGFCSQASFAQINFWQQSWIQYQLSRNANGSGPGVNLRNYDWKVKKRLELQKDADSYMNDLVSNNSILYAPELCDFLHRKLLKLYPEPFLPINFAEIKEIAVITSPAPDIQLLSNGKIVITTGMLCLTESEEELMALLAQQISYLIFDINYEAYRSGQNGAIGAVVLGAAAQVATNVVLNKKSDRYYSNYLWGRLAGDATSLIAAGIFSEVSSHHDLKLQMNADTLTKKFLVMNNMNDQALGRIMFKIWTYAKEHPEYEGVGVLANFDNYEKRLKNIGYSQGSGLSKDDREYRKAIDWAVEQNAALLMKKQDYYGALTLLNRIIDEGIAVEDDYLMKAIVLRYLSDNDKNNAEILELLRLAETRKTNNSEDIDIERGLAYLRMNNKQAANESFIRAKVKVEHALNPSIEQLNWINNIISRNRLL